MLVQTLNYDTDLISVIEIERDTAIKCILKIFVLLIHLRQRFILRSCHH